MPVSVHHSHPKGHASAFVDQAPLGLQPHGPGGRRVPVGQTPSQCGVQPSGAGARPSLG
jgi:hypothetical protein